MGRRKQARPHRSGAVIIDSHDDTPQAEVPKTQQPGIDVVVADETDQPYFVGVDSSCWASNSHLDISEVVLKDLRLTQGFPLPTICDNLCQYPKYSFRFRLCHVKDFVPRIKLGHWPLLSSADCSLELVELVESGAMEDMETDKVVLSGSFDGPDEGISGLVHLVSVEFLTLRPVNGVALLEDMSSLRVRVEILKTAFDACESLLEPTRQLWKKSMINLMAWLRPEVMVSESRYGIGKSTQMDFDLVTGMEGGISNPKRARFDASGFYEAIKPSKQDPMLEDDLPDLLPVLRPYQRRAVYWMVQREKGYSGSMGERERNQFFSPLCLPVGFLDTSSKMFYNPFGGNFSLNPDYTVPYVFGGILADEMGLGKTVELLACLFANRNSSSECGKFIDSTMQITENQKINLKRLKRERVECTCGAVTESHRYKGLWVQCDICDAWQHADCVGYSPKGKRKRSVVNLENKSRKKNAANIVLRDGEHICQLCNELIQATESPIDTGATLIVCPAPILHQWHAEIIRY